MNANRMNVEASRLLALSMAAASLWLAAAGCGESNNGGNGIGSGPAYLVGTRVFASDGAATSYFHVLPSIEQGTAVNPAQALEVPGAAKLYGAFDLGWFAVGDGESPTITRYTLDQNAALRPDQSISMQPYGVASLWDTLYFVSPTKAYYPDREGKQLVVWNPMAMEITGTIPLPQTAREGFLALYGYTPVIRGTKLLFSVGWFDWEMNDSILGETGLVVIDTATDTVARFDVDTRCGGITQTVVTPSGDAYLVSSALAAAGNRLGRLPTAPCALRIAAGADALDSSYLVRLGDLTAGALAGEPIQGGQGKIFLRVFDDTMGTVGADDNTWDVTGQLAWTWWRWDVASNMAARVPELEPATADVLSFEVEGRVYGAETKADYSETTLIELTAAGGPKRALTAPGFLHGVARIR
jgi:hypothetical protein